VPRSTVPLPNIACTVTIMLRHGDQECRRGQIRGICHYMVACLRVSVSLWYDICEGRMSAEYSKYLEDPPESHI